MDRHGETSIPLYNFVAGGMINVREYQRCNQKWTIQRNWQHRTHKTNKTKTQHNMCWTPLYARKQIYNFRVLFTGFHGIDTKCYIWLAQLYNVNICCLVKSIIVSFSYFLCYHLLKQTLLENNRLLQSLWFFF